MEVTRFSINLFGKQKVEDIPVYGFGTYAVEEGGPKARWHHGKSGQLIQREEQFKNFVDSIAGEPFVIIVPTYFLTKHFCTDTIYSSIDLYGIITDLKDNQSKFKNAIQAPRIEGNHGVQVKEQISVNANQCASDAELSNYNKPIGIVFTFDVKKPATAKKTEPAKKPAPPKRKK